MPIKNTHFQRIRFFRIRKAQAHTQIFIYILGLVVMSMVLAIGYKGIHSLTSAAADAKMRNFLLDVENSVSSIQSDVGSSRTHTFYPPGNVNEVCFVDSDSDPSLLDTDTPIKNHDDKLPGIIVSNWKAGSKDNMFLLSSVLEGQLRIGNITVNDVNDVNSECSSVSCFKCFKTSNSILTIKMTGKGDHVMIS